MKPPYGRLFYSLALYSQAIIITSYHHQNCHHLFITNDPSFKPPSLVSLHIHFSCHRLYSTSRHRLCLHKRFNILPAIACSPQVTYAPSITCHRLCPHKRSSSYPIIIKTAITFSSPTIHTVPPSPVLHKLHMPPPSPAFSLPQVVFNYPYYHNFPPPLVSPQAVQHLTRHRLLPQAIIYSLHQIPFRCHRLYSTSHTIITYQ